MNQILSQKVLRYLSLSPLLFALLTLLRPFVSSQSFVAQLFLTPATIFGLVFICVAWFLYLSGFKYGRHILLVQGSISIVSIIFVVLGHFLHSENAIEHLLAPGEVFLLNLTYLFAASYVIQVLYFWMPRTKLFINFLLLIMLLVLLLSIFGHMYSFIGIGENSLLLPLPFGDLFCYLLLALVIFAHTNHMDRLYLNGKILLSFSVMLVAVIGANVLVYKSIDKTDQLSRGIDSSHQYLRDNFQVYFYLDNLRSDAEIYNDTSDAKYARQYQQDKQLYLQTIGQLERQTSRGSSLAVRKSVSSIENLGSQALNLTDESMAQKHHVTTSLAPRDLQLNSEISQILKEVNSESEVYARQLIHQSTQEASSERGIVLGVSLTSALSILLIIFTPLFIRQKVHELATTQDKLQESNKLLSEEMTQAEAVLAGIGDGLFVVDTKGTITVFNQAAAEISGLRQELALGRHFSDALHFSTVSEPEAPLDIIANALRGVTKHLSHNVLLHRTNGQQTKDVSVTASPVKNKNGKVIGAIVVFRDRSSEQALENAKDEFLSLASHQLRTPATATKQFLAMFLQGYAGKIDERQRQFLQEAYDNNELGISIIEDLLNITRLESNRLKIVKEKIELGEFLRKYITQNQVVAQKSGQKLRYVADDEKVYIEADPSLLGMVMDNLITNALKYSDHGNTVTIELRAGDQVSIAVIDEGIGIKKEDMPKLFKRFERLQDPQKQYVVGTGIGLYLVKKIIHKLHGKIRVDSEYGRGSVFTLEFKRT